MNQIWICGSHETSHRSLRVSLTGLDEGDFCPEVFFWPPENVDYTDYILYFLYTRFTFIDGSSKGGSPPLLPFLPLHLSSGQSYGVLVHSLPLAELHRDPLYYLKY